MDVLRSIGLFASRRTSVTPSEPTVAKVLKTLAALLGQPVLFTDQDLTLLTLRSAAVRIALDTSPDGMKTSLDLLWHAALLFEENSPPNVTVSFRMAPKQPEAPAKPE